MLSFAIFVWAAIVVVVVVVVAVYLCICHVPTVYTYSVRARVCVYVRIPAGHLHIMCFLAFAHVFYVLWLLRCYLWHLTPYRPLPLLQQIAFACNCV